MKEYAVRLKDYDGNIVDGLLVEADSEEEARSLYIKFHYTAFADMTPTDKIVITEYHEIPYSYPKYKNSQAYVIAHTAPGKMQKAMFYWNGGKPTFSSYGTDITDSVRAWEYNKEIYDKFGMEIPQ